jgi:hypothetical protein
VRVSPRIGQLSRALRVAMAMPLRGTLDSCSSGGMLPAMGWER